MFVHLADIVNVTVTEDHFSYFQVMVVAGEMKLLKLSEFRSENDLIESFEDELEFRKKCLKVFEEKGNCFRF